MTCAVCGSPEYHGLGLCNWHLTNWEASIERQAALGRPGTAVDEVILDEALDAFIERARTERTWVQ